MRTLIVDDEPQAIEILQVMCASIPGVQLVGIASDGIVALRMVEALKPELLLLDIVMPGIDGLAVARAVQQGPDGPAVIFVSASDRFALRAFDVSAVDYLLKPINQDRLGEAVARASKLLGEKQTHANGSRWIEDLWVPSGGEIVRIAAMDIDLIEAERDYMHLHVGTRSYMLKQTVSELEHRLDPDQFVRLHRSAIIRRAYISRLRHEAGGPWIAQLKNGRELRIGRTYLANVRAMARR